VRARAQPETAQAGEGATEEGGAAGDGVEALGRTRDLDEELYGTEKTDFPLFMRLDEWTNIHRVHAGEPDRQNSPSIPPRGLIRPFIIL